MFFIYRFLIIYIAPFAYCANILAIVPCPMYSHQVVFFNLWNQLSIRGHKVTVITTDPQRNGTLTNLTEIDVSWSYKYFTNVSVDIGKTVSPWSLHSWFLDISNNMSEAQMSHHQVQRLIHEKYIRFDVLLVESLYPEYLGFAEIYRCPTILISSFEVFAHIHHKMGNIAHPVLNPNIGSPIYPPLNFKERVTNLVYSLYKLFFYYYVCYPKKQELMHRFFNTTSTINEVLDKVDMVFLNVIPVMQSPRAIGPTTINIGGLKVSSGSLSIELKEFLDGATSGFIYFSLGSNIKSKDLRAGSLRVIVEALSELPYKVLWKFEAEPEILPFNSHNVKLIKWAPQLKVLEHPNIKVFITQGGLASMQEAIYTEVPCVVIPFFSDQYYNAKLMKSKGISLTVGRHPNIKKEELKYAVMEIINNPKYKKAAARMKILSLDAPMTGLEQAVWWTEYVIRNKGTKHLRNPAADLPLYQYYLIDVVGLITLTAVTTVLLFIFLLKRIYISLMPTLAKTDKKLQ